MPRSRSQMQRIETFTAVSKPIPAVSLSKKRKHDSSVDDVTVVLTTAATPTKRRCVNTNTTSAATLLRNSTSKPSATTRTATSKRSRSPIIQIIVTPPSSRCSSVDPTLPEALEQLKALNAAFLSALTLHYAHNGASSTVDLAILAPSITSIWKKRTVTLRDIRLIVAIIHSTTTSTNGPGSPKFALKDHGHGKVCLQFVPPKRSKRSRTVVQSFHEAHMKDAFATNLESAWQSWKSQNSSSIHNVDAFVDSVELEPLIMHSSSRKILPLRATGQQRLDEVLTPFEKFNISDEENDQPTKRIRTHQPDKENLAPTNPTHRSASLIDRIRAKEARIASLPAAPTKEELERRAALQRSEEVLQILNLLALAKSPATRTSFPLPTLVTSVQSSVRSPLSKNEIVDCVKVLQSEIAPGHISMLTFGSITAVVVDPLRRPLQTIVSQRLRDRGI